MRIPDVARCLLLAVALAGCSPPGDSSAGAGETPASPDTRPVRDSGASLVPAWTVRTPPPALDPPPQTRHTAAASPAAAADTLPPAPAKPIFVDGTTLVDSASPPRSVPAASETVDQDARARTAAWWSAGAVFRWHEVARELTARHELNSSHSSRLFAALAVAQHDAAVAALRLATARRRGDVATESGAAHAATAEQAAIAHASVAVLSEIFPQEHRFLEQNALAHVASRTTAARAYDADAALGQAVGRAVGASVVKRLRSDGAATAREPRVSRQTGKWYSVRQTLPGWAKVTPWVMERGDQFRAPPPPAADSPEFRRALDEVREYSARRSAEQLAISAYWNLGVGGVSVPGMWGSLALQAARAAGWPEARTARLMAVLHMAMFDACIASWDTKYHYLVPRPSMVAPDIDEPLGLPPHPSYTSGHSAFSGAAHAVLAAAFPDRADEYARLAEEASASRFFAGIHYRFDGDEGLRQGRKAGALALAKHPLD